MTTMTLKIAFARRVEDPDALPSTETSLSWKAGVSSVEVLSQRFYRTHEDAQEAHGSGAAICADLPTRNKALTEPEPKMLTLLSVYFGEPGEFRNWQCLLVERAWLLSHTGDTIERIAP